MIIQIKGYLAASGLLENEPGEWDAIVILDSQLNHTEFIATHTRRHLYLVFDDIESTSSRKHLARREQIQEAIDFACESERLLVSCRAGQSRSAAIAFLIAFQKLGALSARELLNPKRHIPNKWITSEGEALLEDPSVGETIGQWWRDHRGMNLSDFYDEISDEIDELERRGVTNRIVA